jgi:hypothetical protein
VEQLYQYVEQLNPAEVWVGYDLVVRQMHTWTAFDGQTIMWNPAEFTMVLVGVDRNAKTVTLATPQPVDQANAVPPYTGELVVASMSQFEASYHQFGDMAVVLQGTGRAMAVQPDQLRRLPATAFDGLA